MMNYSPDVYGSYFTLNDLDLSSIGIACNGCVFKNMETELVDISCGPQASHEEEGQVEIVERQAKGGSGRVKLTPEQKRESKKESDGKYRKKQKRKLEELSAENSSLKNENVRLNEELRRFKSARQEHDCKSLSFLTKSLEGNSGTDVQNLHHQIPLIADELILQRIEADEKSNISFSNFKALDDEPKLENIDKYTFPLSLLPTAKRINDVYGDVSGTSKMNLFVTQVIYTAFCASVKEMGEVHLHQVTEDKIMKWRDAIKDALRIGFEVEFCMDHLVRIGRAYIGRTKIREMEIMARNISELEAEVNRKRSEVDERNVIYKKYMDAAESFNGKSLGLFA